MTITGALVVFTLGWWISFFVVLPIGVRGQFEDGEPVPGTEEGAPSKPMLAKKALWATGGGILITFLAAIIIPRFFSP